MACSDLIVMRNSLSSLVLFILLMSALVSLPYAVHAPRIKVKEGTSANWAGYAVVTSVSSAQNVVVSDVKGSWTVPKVDCSVTPTAYASFWVGIDGYTYSSGTVEQIGTDSVCSSGSPTYYAWYEMYPKHAQKVNMKINFGDVISAEVQYSGRNSFRLTITDTATGKTYTTDQKSPNAQRSSAEWIAEAPWSGGILPLADFGTVTFQNAQATLSGHTGRINDSAWQYDRIDMVSGILIKAQTSALSTDNTSFTVTWVAAQ
jgi:hypothetical protein